MHLWAQTQRTAEEETESTRREALARALSAGTICTKISEPIRVDEERRGLVSGSGSGSALCGALAPDAALIAVRPAQCSFVFVYNARRCAYS